jgi:hypothetical protein
MKGIMIGEKLTVHTRWDKSVFRKKPNHEYSDHELVVQGLMGDIVFVLENGKYPNMITRETWNKLKVNPNSWELE